MDENKRRIEIPRQMVAQIIGDRCDGMCAHDECICNPRHELTIMDAEHALERLGPIHAIIFAYRLGRSEMFTELGNSYDERLRIMEHGTAIDIVTTLDKMFNEVTP